MSMTTCLKGSGISTEDKARLRARRDEYKADGDAPIVASRKAAADLLETAIADREALAKQIRAKGGEVARYVKKEETKQSAEQIKAATKAAAVEMLKVEELSPPVPQVSTTGVVTFTGIALARITLASPAISSTVSPLILSAVTKAAI